MITNNSAPKKRVLFVDDSVKFLDKLRKHLPLWSGDHWELLTTSDITEAFQKLDSQQVDLVVMDDLRTSGIDGLQFLKLVQQKHPHIRKALLAGKHDDDMSKECLRSGADLFLVKPKRSNGFEAIFHSLNQLFDISMDGFRGLLRKVSLADLIQLECLNSRSSVLEFSAGSQFGQVFIKRGNIVHASAGSKSGVEAFIRLMRMPGGDFHFRPFFEPPNLTIGMPCDRLLLEASHALDNDTDLLKNAESTSSNTAWFQRNTNLDTLPNSTIAPTSHIVPVTETASELAGLDGANDFHAFSISPFQVASNDSSAIRTLTQLTDEMNKSRAQLDMQMLDLAILKEELNSCRSELVQMSSCLSDTSPFAQVQAAEVTLSLSKISDDVAGVVSRFDAFFASFTDDSSRFNESSNRLQEAISRLQTGIPEQQLASI